MSAGELFEASERVKMLVEDAVFVKINPAKDPWMRHGWVVEQYVT